MIQAIKCEQHPRGVSSFVPLPYFAEEYKDKNAERQFCYDVRNHETRGTCILHQLNILIQVEKIGSQLMRPSFEID